MDRGQSTLAQRTHPHDSSPRKYVKACSCSSSGKYQSVASKCIRITIECRNWSNLHSARRWFTMNESNDKWSRISNLGNSQSRLFIVPHCISVNGNVEGHSNIAAGKFNGPNVWKDIVQWSWSWLSSKQWKAQGTQAFPLRVLWFVGKLHNLPCRPWKAPAALYRKACRKLCFMALSYLSTATRYVELSNSFRLKLRYQLSPRFIIIYSH